jgi:hypothetical protein
MSKRAGAWLSLKRVAREIRIFAFKLSPYSLVTRKLEVFLSHRLSI